MKSLKNQLSSLLSAEDLKKLEQKENTYELIGVHEHLHFDSSYAHGYSICSNYSVYLKKDINFYLVALTNSYGDCYSGWTSASWASYTIPERIEVSKMKQLHYIPKEKLKVLIWENPNQEEYGLRNTFEIREYVSDEVLLFCSSEGDPYYPSASSGFDFNNQDCYFKKTNRYTGKIKYYIVEGNPTVGKTTLFPEALELEQFNSKNKLHINHLLGYTTVICGGKWSYEKIIKLMKSDEYFYNNVDIVRVNLS